MSRLAWTVMIGVFGVVLAMAIFRLLGAPGAVFVVLLIWCVGLVAGIGGRMAQIAPGTGAAGGLLAAVIVAVTLAVTIAAAPLAPGATRPGLRDLLWAPLVALLAVLGLCALAGWYGVRVGQYFAGRHKT